MVGAALLALLLAATGAVAQQQADGPPRIGFLIAGDPEPNWSLFRKAMSDLGYVEGRTVRYEMRVADAGRGLSGHAAELVRADVKLIVAVLTPSIVAAMRATTKIPVIFNGGAPETGLVKDMARPEGNLTGVFGATSAIAGKSLQLFREIKPTTKTVALLLNTPDPFHRPLQRDVEAAGRAQQIDIIPVMIGSREELPGAFDAIVARGVDGVMVQPSLPLDVTATLAARHRLPSISFRREFVKSGGLMSYGADQAALARTVAGYVEKVLKGAPTSSLPVQLATRFELIVNQKTAKAIGMTFSPMFAARVDEVIE
jgi:putative ABC transport system substrate-binding protein